MKDAWLTTSPMYSYIMSSLIRRMSNDQADNENKQNALSDIVCSSNTITLLLGEHYIYRRVLLLLKPGLRVWKLEWGFATLPTVLQD